MSIKPIATPQTEGRVFGSDWSIGNVAKLLRVNAARGVWRQDATTGGYWAKINQNYIRTVSARHLPTNANLVFMRVEGVNSWYASLCFASEQDYLPWNHAAAEEWLWALFDENRPQLQEDSATAGSQPGNQCARQFTLAKFGT